MPAIGDPSLDLARLLATWRDEDDHAVPVVPIEPSSGFPTRDELIARYQDASRRDLSALPWFR